MKQENRTKYVFEFLLLFVIMPISFSFDLPIYMKLGSGIIGFIYILVFLIKNNYSFFKGAFRLYSRKLAISILIKLILLIVITTSYLYAVNPNALFKIIKINPIMWITFIGIYSFLSVIPQEIIYRSFYFKRYKVLFPNQTLFIFSNALVFSLGHIFFNNLLVIIMTFIGGFLFALTYTKTKSLILVSIEHAIYGCWLFTVGFGDILGFPTP